MPAAVDGPEDAGELIIAIREDRLNRQRLIGAVVLVLGLAAIGFLATAPSRNGSPVSRGAPGGSSASPPVPTKSPAPLFTAPDSHARPSARNTGVRKGTRLTRVGAGTVRASDVTVRRSGATIRNALITGDLLLVGRNITLINSRVVGRVLVTGSGATIASSEMGALSVSGASNVSARKLDIFGILGDDGITVTSDTGRVKNVKIEESWIHSPKVSAGSHYDGIQVRGVHNLTLRGNYFDLGPALPEYNSSIFVEQANGNNFNVSITRNWIDGGGFALYLGGTGITLSDNIFGSNAAFGLLYPTLLPSRFTQGGNVWEDSGKPVTLNAGVTDTLSK
jgi:hypothetical protein